jgi:hypothetical protein
MTAIGNAVSPEVPEEVAISTMRAAWGLT